MHDVDGSVYMMLWGWGGGDGAGASVHVLSH